MAHSDEDDQEMVSGGESKLAQRERNCLQMIEVLMTRLKRMEEKVEERRHACVEDQNADSDICSKMVSGIEQDEFDESSLYQTGNKASLFLAKNSDGPLGHMDVNVTFRSAPVTDAGKRLDVKFEADLPGSTSMQAGATKKGGKHGLTVSIMQAKTRKFGQKKQDEKKQERVKYERRLQSNLEAYVTRAVNELVYRIPGDVCSPDQEGSDFQASGEAGATRHSSRQPGSLAQDSSVLEGQTGTATPTGTQPGSSADDESRSSFMQSSSHAGSGTEQTYMDERSHGADTSRGPTTPGSRQVSRRDGGLTSSQSMQEAWPIPISGTEFNPKLLLSYACERICLPSGEKLFKHFVIGHKSCYLFVYVYWFVHCKFFQDSSDFEQEYLLERVAAIYVELLSLRALESHKDFFFKYYPYVIANAVYWGFYYLCPGSRHLYSKTFRRLLYLECARLLTGVEVCPTSVSVLHAQLFPDEAQDEAQDPEGELGDALPPLPQSSKVLNGEFAGNTGKQTQRRTMRRRGTDAGDKSGNRSMKKHARDRTSKQARSLAGHGHGGVLSAPDLHNPEGDRGSPSKQDTGNALTQTGKQASLVVDAERVMQLAYKQRSSSAPHLGVQSPTRGPAATDGSLHSSPSIRSLDDRSEANSFRQTDSMHSLPLVHGPPPVTKFVGSRDTIRFRPKIPDTLVSALPRQQKGPFDASGVSPLMQQYLEHHSATAGRRSERVKRTTPVSWCLTGGTETFRRTESRKEFHDSLSAQYKAMKKQWRQDNKDEREAYFKSLDAIERERIKVRRGGPVSVGRYSLDLVNEINQRSKESAKRRMEKEKEKERQREEIMKERKKKELEERRERQRRKAGLLN